MNKILIGWIALSLGLTAQAETFTIDPGHAEIGFSVKHMMVSNSKGNFTSFSGTFDYDIASKILKSAEGVIEVASIDTNNGKRDDHLKNADFFNVAKFPKMTFKSTSIKKNPDGSFELAGILNVLGVDHEIVLPVTITGPIDDPWGNQRIGVECITVLNRRELGITNSPAAMIADDVKISIEVEATYK